MTDGHSGKDVSAYPRSHTYTHMHSPMQHDYAIGSHFPKKCRGVRLLAHFLNLLPYSSA